MLRVKVDGDGEPVFGEFPYVWRWRDIWPAAKEARELNKFLFRILPTIIIGKRYTEYDLGGNYWYELTSERETKDANN
jgi:hypothetical protein